MQDECFTSHVLFQNFEVFGSGRNESLENITSLTAFTQVSTLSLPSFPLFLSPSPPQARLRKYWNDERRLHLFLPLSPHIHHGPVHISCLHARGQSASPSRRRASDDAIVLSLSPRPRVAQPSSRLKYNAPLHISAALFCGLLTLTCPDFFGLI